MRATNVIVATNSPVNVRVPIHTKQAPYRTYAIAAKIPRNALADALCWDTHDPYHYVRLHPLSERTNAVIIGGEDHKSGDDGEARFTSLEQWARDRLPQIGELTHRWSGQCLEPADYVGFSKDIEGFATLGFLSQSAALLNLRSSSMKIARAVLILT